MVDNKKLCVSDRLKLLHIILYTEWRASYKKKKIFFNKFFKKLIF